VIVADRGRPAVQPGAGGGRLHARCLARRGMLHSECEAFDAVVLGAGVCYDLPGRDGTEAVWYVLRGTVALVGGVQPVLGEGELLLAGDGAAVHLHGGPFGAELLCVTVLPERVSRQLPERRPDLGR